MNMHLPFILKYKVKKSFLIFLLIGPLVLISFAQNQTQPDYAGNPKYIETMSVVDKVIAGNNYVGNLNPDSLATLPFGIIKEIGTTRYVIAIDSAVFLPGIAMYSAYMAIEFPGSTERLAFAGKNLAFNPKGVIPGNNTRLMLVSDQKINISPKVKLVLKGDGTNYIEWDCNGFKAIRLKGSFEFTNAMLVPDPAFTKDSTVKATFDIYTSDVHNFITQVNITPFSIKGLNDVFFSVTDATVDMSEVANAPGMIFPRGYQISSIGPNINMWTGFYLKQFKIKLPKEISKNNTSTEIFANNFFIDKSGVTGNFQATNLFSTAEGTMSGWGFSIDQIGLNFVSNNLNGGNLSGKILLPLNNLTGVAYTAGVFQNPQTEQTDFSFSVSPVTNYTASVFSATMDIYPTSKITVQKINGTFKPSADLNGKITFSHSDMKSPALEMQHVVLITDAPFLKSGIFSFTNGSSSDSASGNLSGFNISFNSINVLVNSTSPGIGFNAGINFTSKNELAFGAAATFNILTTVTTNTIVNFAPIWKFDKVLVNDIALDIQTCAFKFDGLIKFRNNSPTYGKGFYGTLSLTVPGIIPNAETANVWFGSKNNFTYFYFDLAIPATIVLVPPGDSPEGIAIYRFMGGLYYHMKPASVNMASRLYTSAFGSAQNYIPDSTISIGIKAGVTLGTYPNNNILNGDVALEINFTSSGGLGAIQFTGDAFMFVKIADRTPVPKTTIPVKVSLSIIYDNQNTIFHALLNADINLQAIKTHGQIEFHTDPKIWYVCFGKPQNRISVDVLGIATLSAYIMLGNQIDPVPPPPNQVASIFGHGFADTRDNTKLSNGNGFVLGASFQAASSGSFGLSDFSVYYNLGYLVGFDIMAFDYGNKAHCSGSSNAAGFNGWYAQGDVYAALWGSVGAKGSYAGVDFDVQLVSISAAALLGGKFPNPSHVKGEVAVNYNFLKVFKGNFNFGFESGNDCNVTN